MTLLRLLFLTAYASVFLCVEATIRPKSIKLGMLFPLLRKESMAKDFGGANRLRHALAAIEDINNKTDGRYDDILPETEIKYTLRDSKRDSGEATLGALDLLQNWGAQIILGPASSTPTMTVQSVLKTFNVPQISYSATSKALSDSKVYPTFARTAPTDTITAQVLVRFLKKEMKWYHISVMHGDDAYSDSGAEDVINEAKAQNMTIVATEKFVSGTESVIYNLERIKAAKCKLIILFTQYFDYDSEEAAKLKMTGEYGYTWIHVRLTVLPQDERLWLPKVPSLLSI